MSTDDAAVDIIWEDHPCLVLNKTAGILTQSPPGIDSLSDRLTSFLKQREQRTGNIYVGVPHRLDRPVSGAIVFARNIRATRRIAEQFAGRLVNKTYWAIVSQPLTPSAGTLIDYMRKVPGEPRAEIVDERARDARRAVLHYQTLQSSQLGTWLEIHLETGRTHQIRVQLAARGAPVLGDEQYGSPQGFGPPYHDARLRWIALHARSLEFQHPKHRTHVRVVADLHQPWHEFLDAANWGTV